MQLWSLNFLLFLNFLNCLLCLPLSCKEKGFEEQTFLQCKAVTIVFEAPYISENITNFLEINLADLLHFSLVNTNIRLSVQQKVIENYGQKADRNEQKLLDNYCSLSSIIPKNITNNPRIFPVQKMEILSLLEHSIHLLKQRNSTFQKLFADFNDQYFYNREKKVTYHLSYTKNPFYKIETIDKKNFSFGSDKHFFEESQRILDAVEKLKRDANFQKDLERFRYNQFKKFKRGLEAELKPDFSFKVLSRILDRLFALLLDLAPEDFSTFCENTKKFREKEQYWQKMRGKMREIWRNQLPKNVKNLAEAENFYPSIELVCKDANLPNIVEIRENCLVYRQKILNFCNTIETKIYRKLSNMTDSEQDFIAILNLFKRYYTP